MPLGEIHPSFLCDDQKLWESAVCTLKPVIHCSELGQFSRDQPKFDLWARWLYQSQSTKWFYLPRSCPLFLLAIIAGSYSHHQCTVALQEVVTGRVDGEIQQYSFSPMVEGLKIKSMDCFNSSKHMDKSSNPSPLNPKNPKWKVLAGYKTNEAV